MARTPSRPSGHRTAPRRRLASEVRQPKILDAALAEFSRRGFARTTVDHIAHRAHLSKGGVYAHFRSKQHILESLARRSLRPPRIDASLVNRVTSGRALIQLLIDETYKNLFERDAIHTLRLLIAEGTRLGHVIEEWREQVIQKFEREMRALLQKGIARGLLRRSVVLEEVSLLGAPAVHAAVLHILGDRRASKEGLARWRRAHVILLCELLLPAQQREYREQLERSARNGHRPDTGSAEDQISCTRRRAPESQL